MLTNIFNIVDTNLAILYSFLTSLFCGSLLAFIYTLRYKFSRGMILTLVLLPCIVMSVIMVINGNLETSVAVLGTFCLVRFRSAQGSAKDITFVFLSMTIGICTGVGHIVFALVMTAVLLAIALVIKIIPIKTASVTLARHLKVSVPDDIAYEKEFKEIFEKFTTKVDVISIKTSQLGSLYEIKYNIVLKKGSTEKELIDQLRIKNSNLPIVCNVTTVVNEYGENSL